MVELLVVREPDSGAVVTTVYADDVVAVLS
jgi:hypothetical protein